MSTALVPLRVTGAEDVHLVAFSPAGAGGSTYRPWVAELSPGVALWGVRLPGRENRMREPFVTGLPELARSLVGEISAIDGPVALFGHSFGALLAYSVAELMAAAPPIWLGLSGLDPLGTDQGESDSDEELLRRLVGWGGLPADLAGHTELLRLTLPALRADLVLVARGRPVTGAPERCPVSLFGGRDDPLAGREALLRWRAQAAGELGLRQYPGGHFYFADRPGVLVGDICADVRRAAQNQTAQNQTAQNRP